MLRSITYQMCSWLQSMHPWDTKREREWIKGLLVLIIRCNECHVDIYSPGPLAPSLTCVVPWGCLICSEEDIQTGKAWTASVALFACPLCF